MYSKTDTDTDEGGDLNLLVNLFRDMRKDMGNQKAETARLNKSFRQQQEETVRLAKSLRQQQEERKICPF